MNILNPTPCCPTCRTEMVAVSITHPGGWRCLRCYPYLAPSLWCEGPPPKDVLIWMWRPGMSAPAIRETLLTRPGGLLLTGSGSLEPWTADMRWQPLERPAPPEEGL